MAKVCEFCGKGPMAGRSIIRHGLAKYKGGIGMHTTGITKRRFLPNLKVVRIKDGGSTRRVKVCTSCLKSSNIVKA
jgi:large subunit ribosomal protein L28